MACEKAALRLTVCNFVSNHIVILKLFLFAQINIKIKTNLSEYRVQQAELYF